MKILFIGGSLNQTSMLHKISMHLYEHEIYFSPYYADGLIHFLAKIGALNKTILGGRHRQDTMLYLKENNLNLDIGFKQNDYDLVLTGTDVKKTSAINDCCWFRRESQFLKDLCSSLSIP